MKISVIGTGYVGLLSHGASLVVHDPVAMREARHSFGEQDRLGYAETPLGAAQVADALISMDAICLIRCSWAPQVSNISVSGEDKHKSRIIGMNLAFSFF